MRNVFPSEKAGGAGVRSKSVSIAMSVCVPVHARKRDQQDKTQHKYCKVPYNCVRQ